MDARRTLAVVLTVLTLVPTVLPPSTAAGACVATGTEAQTALDEAAPGATITLCAGTILAELQITKPVTLQGAGMTATTLAPVSALAAGPHYGIRIAAGVDDVTIRDLALAGYAALDPLSRGPASLDRSGGIALWGAEASHRVLIERVRIDASAWAGILVGGSAAPHEAITLRDVDLADSGFAHVLIDGATGVQLERVQGEGTSAVAAWLTDVHDVAWVGGRLGAPLGGGVTALYVGPSLDHSRQSSGVSVQATQFSPSSPVFDAVLDSIGGVTWQPATGRALSIGSTNATGAPLAAQGVTSVPLAPAQLVTTAGLYGLIPSDPGTILPLDELLGPSGAIGVGLTSAAVVKATGDLLLCAASAYAECDVPDDQRGTGEASEIVHAIADVLDGPIANVLCTAFGVAASTAPTGDPAAERDVGECAAQRRAALHALLTVVLPELNLAPGERVARAMDAYDAAVCGSLGEDAGRAEDCAASYHHKLTMQYAWLVWTGLRDKLTRFSLLNKDVCAGDATCVGRSGICTMGPATCIGPKEILYGMDNLGFDGIAGPIEDALGWVQPLPLALPRTLVEGLIAAAGPTRVRDQADLEAMAGCLGKGDDCLVTAFFDDPSASETAWTLPYSDAATNGDLRFVATGLRPYDPEGGAPTLASHDAVGPIAGSWEPVILCRYYPQTGAAQTCAGKVSRSQFELANTWAPSAHAQRYDRDRVATPGAHAQGDLTILHGPDATLLKRVGPAVVIADPASFDPTAGAAVPETLSALSSFLPSQVGTTGHEISGVASDSIGQLSLTCAVEVAAALVACPDVASGPMRNASSTHVALECTGDRPRGLDEGYELRFFAEAWSHTCRPGQPPAQMTWTQFLGREHARAMDLLQAQGPTPDPAQLEELDAILRHSVARRIALAIPGRGFASPQLEADPQVADGNAVVPLTSDGPNANLYSLVVDVPDRLAASQWSRVERPGLAIGTTAVLTSNVRFDTAEGDAIELRYVFELVGASGRIPSPPVGARLGKELGVEVVALPPPGAAPVAWDAQHQFGLVELSANGASLATGFLQAGATIPFDTSSLTACVEDLASANAAGGASNLLDVDRLAALPDDAATCASFALSVPDLSLHLPLAVTLELRESSYIQVGGLDGWIEIIGDPLDVNWSSPDLDLTRPRPLREVLKTTAGAARGLAIDAVALRIVLTLPLLDPVTKADVVTKLVDLLAPVVTTVAVELADVPLTPDLEKVIGDAVEVYGTAVLVPAGALPVSALHLPAQDKLMTITGLAAFPAVLTIGSGTLCGGPSALSRRGPTPLLFPKPDFLAPTLVGAPSTSVLSALPFVEALAMQGIQNVHFVRAVLAGFARPTLRPEQESLNLTACLTGSSDGAIPATFYEQGYGVLDITPSLALGGAADVLALAGEMAGKTAEEIAQRGAAALDTDPAAFTSSPPGAVLAAVGSPANLLRATLGTSIVNIAIDTPVVPAHLQADFGVVNHELPGVARFNAHEVDGLLELVDGRLDTIARNFARTDLPASDILAQLVQLVNFTAVGGQDVTLNATHYYLFDALQDDLLFTLYDDMLDHAVADAPSLPRDPAALGRVKARLEPWLLDPSYFVPETRRTVRSEYAEDPACELIPTSRVFELVDESLEVAQDEIALLEDATNTGVFADLGSSLPASSRDLVSYANRGFLQSQLDQVTCLGDLIWLLEYVRDRIERLRDLRDLPASAYSEAEDRYARWDDRVLGGDVQRTLGAMEVEGALTRNAATLEIVIRALNETITLLVATLKALELPVLERQASTPLGLVTMPERTAPARLGAYIGLATMTSHNVKLYDPITGNVILQRDITVPVPSFLWNNPTLTVDAAYRDGSPLANTTWFFKDQAARIFGQGVALKSDVTLDGLRIPLVPDPSTTYGPARGMLDSQIQDLHALLAALDALPPGQQNAYTKLLRGQVVTLQAQLEGLLEALEMLLSGQSSTLARLTEDALERIVQKLYSRLDYQITVLDQQGRGELPNLFPGSYRLLLPYAYPAAGILDQQTGFLNPGAGNELADLDLSALRTARTRIVGLPGDMSALVDPDADPARAQLLADLAESSIAGLGQGNLPPNVDYFPALEQDGDRYGDFHQFGLDVGTSPDLFAFLCAELQNFTDLTRTPLDTDLCATVAMPEILRATIAQDLAVLDCILKGKAGLPAGLEEDTLPPELRQVCAELHDEIAKQLALCEQGFPAACATKQRLLDFLNVTREVSILLPAILPQSKLIVPFVHSPIRALIERPAALGYTPQALLAATKAANPGTTLTDAQILDIIDRALKSLDLGRVRAQVVEPPREGEFRHTASQGFLHHFTDRVSGFDWWHAETGVPPVDIAPEQAAQRVQEELALAKNSTSPPVPWFASAEAAGLDAPTLTAAFQDGLRAAFPDRVARMPPGWTAAGAPANITLPPRSLLPLELTAEQFCLAQEQATGLTREYYDCQALHLERSEGEVQGYGGLDRVSFASQLHTLGRLRGPNATPAELAADLQTATALSATQGTTRWTRTTDGIRVESALPVAGLLRYDVPLPVSEIVQYNVQGEILLENTAALVVTSTDARFVSDLTERVGALPLPVAVGGAAGTLDVLGTFIEVINALGGDAARPDLRVDAIGFPVRLYEKHEQKASLNTRCTFCSDAALVARPDGYYDYNRLHEMTTRHVSNGPELLHVLVIYFPSLTGDGIPGGQRVIFRDFRVQGVTFIGYANKEGRNTNEFSVSFPLRHRANVEEWNMLAALPDQLPATLGGSVQIRSTVAGTAWDPTHFLAPVSTGGSGALCASDNVVGFHLFDEHGRRRPYVRNPHGQPSPFFAGTSVRCLRNTIEGLRPAHIELGGGSFGGILPSSKKLVDVIRYVLNVDGVPLEEFSRSYAEYASFTCNALCDPVPLLVQDANSLIGRTDDVVLLLTGRLPAGNDASTRLVNAARDTIVGSLGALEKLHPLRTSVVGLSLSGKSFLPEAQHGSTADAQAGKPLHIYALMNASEARAMGDAWDTSRTFTWYDKSDPARASDVHRPAENAYHGERMRMGNQWDPHALVVATGTRAGIVQPEVEPGAKATETLSYLQGNGQSGAGWALSVELQEPAKWGDTNETRAAVGLYAAAGVKFVATLYVLGGVGTPSACSGLPLWDLIAPYFRCTGMQVTKFSGGAAAGASPGECVDPIADFVKIAEDEAVLRASRAPADGVGLTDPLNDRAYDALFGQPGATPSPPSVGEFKTGPLADSVAKIAGAAAEAATCITRSAGAGAGLNRPEVGTDLAGIFRAFLADTVGVGNAARALTDSVDPRLNLDATAPLVVHLGIPPGVVSNGISPRNGDLVVSSLVWERAAEVQTGTLTVTDEAPDGAITVTTLRSFDTGSAWTNTLALQHAHRYTIELEATSTVGETYSDSVSFVVDALPPRVTSADSPTIAGATIPISWRVEDDASGATEVVVETRLPGGAWTHVASEPLGAAAEMARTTSVTTDAASGARVDQRILVRDAAGHRTLVGTDEVDDFADGLAGWSHLHGSYGRGALVGAPGSVQFRAYNEDWGSERWGHALDPYLTTANDFAVSWTWTTERVGEGCATPVMLAGADPNARGFLKLNGEPFGRLHVQICSTVQAQTGTLRYIGWDGVQKEASFAPGAGSVEIELRYTAADHRVSLTARSPGRSSIASLLLPVDAVFREVAMGVDPSAGGNDDAPPYLATLDDLRIARGPTLATLIDRAAPSFDMVPLAEVVTREPKVTLEWSVIDLESALTNVVVTREGQPILVRSAGPDERLTLAVDALRQDAPSGSLTFVASATDAAGNTARSESRIRFDDAAPGSEAPLAPSSQSAALAPMSIRLDRTIVDPEGDLARVTTYVDLLNAQAIDTDTTTIHPPPGPYAASAELALAGLDGHVARIALVAEDQTGRLATWRTARIVDETSPTVTIDITNADADGLLEAREIAIDWAAHDAWSGLRSYRVALVDRTGAETPLAEGSLDAPIRARVDLLAPIPSGPVFTVRVDVLDGAGNVATATSRPIRFDAPPTLTGIPLDGHVTLTWPRTDAADLTEFRLFRLDGQTRTLVATLGPLDRLYKETAANDAQATYELLPVGVEGERASSRVSVTPSAANNARVDLVPVGPGANGWHRGDVAVGFVPNGPSDASGYRGISNIVVMRDGEPRTRIVYIDELESLVGWQVEGGTLVSKPSIALETGSFRQGAASLKATVANDPATSSDSAPKLVKAFDVDLTGLDTIDLYTTYGTTHPSATTGKIDVQAYDGATLLASVTGVTVLKGSWAPVRLALPATGPHHLSRMVFTLHEARKSATNVEVQSFYLDGIHAWDRASSRETEEGISIWNAELTDALGVRQITDATALKLDLTAPVTTASIGGPIGNAGWYVGSAIASFVANDALSGVDSTKYRINGGATQTAMGNATISGQGQQCLTYWSIDVAGKAEAPRAAPCVKIDSVAPTITFSPRGTGDGTWFSSDVVIDMTASDATSGVARIRASLDGGESVEDVATVSRVATAIGPHTVTARAWDHAGNGGAEHARTYTIEKTAPRVTERFPAPGATDTGAKATLRASFDDAADALASGIDPTRTVLRVEQSLTGGATWSDITTSGTIVRNATQITWKSSDSGGMPPGRYRITGTVYDRAGNAAAIEPAAPWTFSVPVQTGGIGIKA